MQRSRLTLPLWLGLGLAASLPTSAQVFTPKDINLDVSFITANPAVVALLNAPGGPGLDQLFVTATTDPAPPGGVRQALFNFAASGPLSTSNVVTVDDTEGGLIYSTSVLAQLKSGQQYYFPSVAGLSTAGAPPPAWSIANTVSVVNFHFVDAGATPVPLVGGLILSQDTDAPNSAFNNLNLAGGATSAAFVAQGGTRPRFTVYADLGGDDPAVGNYRRKYVVGDYEATALPADTVIERPVVIDVAGDTSGSLVGRFDVTHPAVSAASAPTVDDGYFELFAPTPTPGDQRSDFPVVRVIFNAGDGYGNWERHALFTGANFSSEASGAFTAANLLPSPPIGEGFYTAFGETFLRTVVPGNPPGVYQLQYLRTPILGGGLNPAPTIPSGALDLGDAFVLKPGALTGNLTLQGPPAVAGQISLLDRIQRSTDGDLNADGLPDSDPLEWFHGSLLWANGVDALASGATTSASGGQAFLPLPGGSTAFNPTTGAYTAPYRFALGGLHGQNSYWKSDSVTLRLVEQGTTPAAYFDTLLTITDRSAETDLRREIISGAATSLDVIHAFGEVNVTIRSLAGTIYQPDIRRVIDDPEFAPNDVAVTAFAAFGWPVSQAEAAVTGTVRTLLPAGTWIITPRVNPGDQPAGSNVDLLPIKINVPAGGRVNLETGFVLQAEIPRYLAGPSAIISGTVASDFIAVTQIHYSIDGGPDILVSNPGAVNPTFSLDLSALANGPHTIRITATGAGGESSFVEGTFIRDASGLIIQSAVILRWSYGVLQRSSDLNTWTDVPEAVSPFAEPLTSPRQFWRVRYE